MDDIISTEKLIYTYEGNRKPSMDDVNIHIKKGVKTVILGANGAGKSTLFYHFNGITKPGSGRVIAFGKPVSYRRKALRGLRSRIAVVLQNPDDQIFELTVEEDIAYGPKNLNLSEEEVKRRVDEAIFQVGLDDLREKSTMQLSYGQRKRLALAGALAMKPELLVMDEPTAGLDPQMALELMELAEQLHHNGTTVVLSTHDVDLAYAWADEIHVLRNGNLIYSGTSEGFYKDPVTVYNTGLTQPSMYVVNSNLALMNGIPEAPYPRTESQLVSKMASGKKGTLTIVPVEDRLDRDIMDAVCRDRRPAVRGLFGTISRKLLYTNKLRCDFVFDGFESCVCECLKGEDAALFCDADCVDLILDKMKTLGEFGSDIAHDIYRPRYRSGSRDVGRSHGEIMINGASWGIRTPVQPLTRRWQDRAVPNWLRHPNAVLLLYFASKRRG